MPPKALRLETFVEDVRQEIKVTSLSESRSLALLNDEQVFEYLYPKGYIFIADAWMAAPATQCEIKKLLLKSDIYVSGALASGNLGLSNGRMDVCPLGITFRFAYTGCPDINIIKAHIIKATDQHTKICGLLSDHPKTTRHSSLAKDETTQQPLLAWSIVFPQEVARDVIIEFIRRTFRCEPSVDYIPQIGLFETPYK
jgi:hypothetical protein